MNRNEARASRQHFLFWVLLAVLFFTPNTDAQDCTNDYPKLPSDFSDSSLMRTWEQSYREWCTRHGGTIGDSQGLSCLPGLHWCQDGPSAITVTFKTSTDDREAVWVLQSYNLPYQYSPRKVYLIHLSSIDPESLEKSLKRILDAFYKNQFGNSNTSPIEMTDNKADIFLLGDITRDSMLQQKLASLLEPPVIVEWQSTPGTAIVSVPQNGAADWIETFKGEETVQHAEYFSIFHDLASRAQSSRNLRFFGSIFQHRPDWLSVEASTRVEAESVKAEYFARTEASTAALAAKGNKEGGLKRAGRTIKPKEIDIINRLELPSAATIMDFIRNFHAKEDPRVTLVKSDRDRSGEYLEILVDHVKGVITSPPYWERLRYSIPIYMADKGTMKIRCILAGQFAPGIGESVPTDESFQDMEPQYTRALQDHVGRFIQALQTYIVGGKVGD